MPPVPHDTHILEALVEVIVLSALALSFAQRLRIPAVPSFLVTGAIIGPLSLGIVADPIDFAEISEFAIILLLFNIGLEIQFESIRNEIVKFVGAGLGACLICFAAISGLGMLVGLDLFSALVIGMAGSLSSTAVVLQLLKSGKIERSPSGRLSIAILVMQDILVVFMLAVIPFFVAGDAAPETVGGLIGLTIRRPVLGFIGTVFSVLSLVLAGRLLFPLFLRQAVRSGSQQVLVVSGVAVAMAAAEVAHLIGFSLPMGGFLAGVILAGTQCRHQLSGLISPLRDLFLAIFFVSIGMQLDLALAWDSLLILGLGLATLLTVKIVAINVISKFFGFASGASLAAGFFLAQSGEFSLLLIGRASSFNILDEQTTALSLAVIVLSLIITPGLMNLGGLLGRKVEGASLGQKEASLNRKNEENRPIAIVAGYGRVGEEAADELQLAGYQCIVIEQNLTSVKELQAKGRPAVLGDVQVREVLETAGIEKARIFIIAIPDEKSAIAGSSIARAANEDLRIIIRIQHEFTVEKARKSGADAIIVEETVTANQMADTIKRYVNFI